MNTYMSFAETTVQHLGPGVVGIALCIISYELVVK